MKILFVDDNLGGMKFHVMHLSRIPGVEVTPVDDLDRALTMFEKDPASWTGVIIDLMMPKGSIVPEQADVQESGRYLLEGLRSLRPNVPAVILTNVETHPVLLVLETQVPIKIMNKKDRLAAEFARIVVEFFRECK